MATTSSPMTSQLKSSFTSSLTGRLVVPKGISGAPFRISPDKTRTPCFTVKAVQADKPTYQVIQPINGDLFIGSLETPVTSSPLVAWYLSNLPGYRTAVSPLLRGIEVGLAHGFFSSKCLLQSNLGANGKQLQRTIFILRYWLLLPRKSSSTRV